jgi:type 2 lantibiotic biosynthesis protein LanM
MHQENIIAAGAHPVPIDLEMILQAADPRSGLDADDTAQAYDTAMQTVIDSVLTVGLLPAYGKYSASKIFAIGGVTSNSTPRVELAWEDINSDAMRPVKAADTSTTISNLPHIDGQYARLGDHLDAFMSGFRNYAEFLHREGPQQILAGFAGLTIRTVLRPTRFYYMLLQRLRNHRTWDDGIVWSAQADFAARLADWEHDTDPTWPLQHAERVAVVDLNVPHFVTASDGHEIRDAAGTSMTSTGAAGLDRARDRLRGLDADEIGWQAEIIRQNTETMRRSDATAARELIAYSNASRQLTDEADALAQTLAERAIRRGPGAAWIGLDWLGDSEVSQLVVLGPDLYNGACGIAVYLAAHAAVTDSASSHELALAAIARLRRSLRGRNPSRTARSLGVGGGLGLGSIVYGLAVVAALLHDEDVLADAHAAAELITDDVIAADRQFDVLGGSAGAILGLLRLHRQTGSADALNRAMNCGGHLLARPRTTPPLNGMSHGAAGFAYALAMLAEATGDRQFADAAGECIDTENASFDAERDNWPRRDGADLHWPCKWCHGAPGIGLARSAIARHTGLFADRCRTDVERALAGVQRGWPGPTDTLCCGTLGSIEFLWEAGTVLGRRDLHELASRHQMSVVATAHSAGDYRWSNGTSRFNLGLFRGVAGVGYTVLRRVDDSLPNILVWE